MNEHKNHDHMLNYHERHTHHETIHKNNKACELTYTPKDIAGKLAKAFLNSPLTSILGIFLLAIGYIALVITPREENPQIKVAGAAIIVALPGAKASEVEKVIVRPLERKIKEIKAVEHIYGYAMDDVGIVNVQFYIGEEKQRSDVKVYDKIMQNIDIFPKGIMPPIIKPLDIDTDIPIMSIAFYSKDGKLDEIELAKKIDKVQHRINAIENVAVTNLIGQKREQFNILVDAQKLAGYNLSMGQIAMAVKALAINVPDVKTNTKENELVVFGIKNAIESVKDLENIIVAQYMGSVIYLKDVATITRGVDIQNKKAAEIYLKEDSFKNGYPQITLTVSKLQGSNAVVITHEITKLLESLKEELNKEGVYYTITRDDGDRANDAVNELVFHIFISVVIIALLLIFALGWRESLIVTFTVPAIFAITLFIAYLTGQTINRITLFALLLSLGLLVDAAIIVIENIHRHFHAHDAKDKTTDDILIEATDEIGSPTNIATIAIILTMIPMAFVGQMMGQYMGPIPKNVPVALIASLFVAYIFTPYLAKKLIKREK